MSKKSSFTKSDKKKLKAKLLQVTTYKVICEKAKGGVSVNTLVNYFGDKRPVSPEKELLIVKIAKQEIERAEKRRKAILMKALAA